VALGLQHLAWPFMSSTPFLFFYGAVMVAGWWGGWGPALVTTALTLPAVDYYFLRPFHTFRVGLGDALALGIFALLSLLMTKLNVALRRTNAERAEFLQRERAARNEVEAERTRLHSLFMQAPAYVTLFRGPEHTYVLSNPLNNQALGNRDVLGKPLREAAPEAEAQGFVALLDRVYTTGEPISAKEVLTRVQKADGSFEEIFINIVYQPTRDAEGRIDGIATFAFDVTPLVQARQKAEALASELRQSEERYRTFVSQSTEGIFRLDVEPPIAVTLPEDEQIDAMFRTGIVAECNDAMARMYGFERASELAGTRLDQLLVREDPRNTEYLRTFIQGGYRIEEAESQEVDREGRRKVFINNFVGVVKEGRLVGAWGIQREVTEQRRLYQEAQEAIRVRDEFLSVASHELKTPLTPLSLRLQALAQETERQPDSPYVQKVRASVEVGRRQVTKLATLIGDLLDVSRIVAGRLRLEREDVDLAGVVRDVASRYELHATRVGSPLRVDVPGVVQGRWDALRVEQVVTNLVDNAIKYGAGKPVHIRLVVEAGDASLVVQDEGIGIAPEHLSRIFGRFERAVSERNYGGLGLGLYISKTLVEAMGGEIRVASTPGQGATFTVRLPLREAGSGATSPSTPS
jgi:signal transduction histidine kinase